MCLGSKSGEFTLSMWIFRNLSYLRNLRFCSISETGLRYRRLPLAVEARRLRVVELLLLFSPPFWEPMYFYQNELNEQKRILEEFQELRDLHRYP